MENEKHDATKKVKRVLEEFVKACKKRFGKNLVSIILFGCYARGTATEYSDVDLLVIAKNIHGNLFKGSDLMGEFVTYAIKKYHIRIFPIFYEPEDFSTEFINPLVYGILTGYKVLFGDSFWSNFIEEIRPVIKEDIELVKEFVETSKSDLESAQNEMIVSTNKIRWCLY